MKPPEKESYTGVEDPICAACRAPIGFGMLYNLLGEKRYHAGVNSEACQATRVIDNASHTIEERAADLYADANVLRHHLVPPPEGVPRHMEPATAAGARAWTGVLEATQPKRVLRVYVAGASKEPERCRAAMRAVEAFGGIITLDWLAAIEAEGAANEGLDDAKRHKYAMADLAAVAAADVVWLLASDKHTTGSWVELGFALGRLDAKGGDIIVSGKARERCIFASLATVEFDQDMEALAWMWRRLR